MIETGEKHASLLALLMASPRPHRLVDFPRKGADGKPVGQVAICPLTQGEAMAAQAAAEQKARRLLKEKIGKDEASKGYADLYANAAMNEILFRGIRQSDDPTKPLFQAVQHIEQHLSTDEAGVLFNSYLRVQAECSPINADPGSDDELEAWAMTLARVGSLGPLDSWSQGALMMFVKYLVNRLFASPTDNLTTGSPPEDGDDTQKSVPASAP